MGRTKNFLDGLNLTEEELNEYIKCSKDPTHFIENYCQVISLDEGMVKFKLRGYQKELIQHSQKRLKKKFLIII